MEEGSAHRNGGIHIQDLDCLPNTALVGAARAGNAWLCREQTSFCF